ncbi:Like-Sm ribonucleoprotein (LSM)-related domain protein [Rhodotorula toruloides]|nr:Like-Sm ribonucleoprotein (LSM)-related domain protein [Rhodotorula toruloides]
MATTTSIPALPPFNTLKPPPALTLSIAALTSTLATLYRLTVSHTSRQFIGTFVCLDPQGNIVLDQAIEYELDSEGGVKGEGREVGLVMVPRKWWSRVERMRTQEEVEEEWASREGERRKELQQEGCRPS